MISSTEPKFYKNTVEYDESRKRHNRINKERKRFKKETREKRLLAEILTRDKCLT